jgi:hypothetical protein
MEQINLNNNEKNNKKYMVLLQELGKYSRNISDV